MDGGGAATFVRSHGELVECGGALLAWRWLMGGGWIVGGCRLVSYKYAKQPFAYGTDCH